MILQPGCRFAVAPHFHLPAEWAQRLRVGTGVAETDGRFFPQPSWRPPTTDELSLLVRAADGPTTSEELEASVCLFQLPGHLRSEWWKLLEQSAGVLGEGPLAGFESFAGRVGEFLAFKGLPIPAGASYDVVVSKPGQWSVPWRPEASCPVGLFCNPATGALRLWGGINLGDEETSVVLINLPWRQLEEELRRRFPDQSSPAVGELVGQFLRSCSDYPPVRLILGPGEGYRLPQGGLILDGYGGDKQEPDVLLLISHQSARCT
ncbi:MAG TPA: hypothetical protein VKD72_29370 [Gemmataceae bacterium]|nr:hypothetical protein [Gemmataceae bacterium]